MKAAGSRIVLDASITLPLFLQDEDSTAIRSLLQQLDDEDLALLTSPHWRLECWSGVMGAERRGRISEDTARDARVELSQLPVVRLPDHAPEDLIFELARRHRLSIYDAAHLALALQEGALLATGDNALATAAKEHGALWVNA